MRARLSKTSSHIVGPEFDLNGITDEVVPLRATYVTRRQPADAGEVVTGAPADFEIEGRDADPRRLKRLRIVRSKDSRQRPDRITKRRDAKAPVPARGDSRGSPPDRSSLRLRWLVLPVPRLLGADPRLSHAVVLSSGCECSRIAFIARTQPAIDLGPCALQRVAVLFPNFRVASCAASRIVRRKP